MLPLAAADLEVLRKLDRLEVLELEGPIEIGDELRASAAKGGQIPTLPFDEAFGAAIAGSVDVSASTLVKLLGGLKEMGVLEFAE